MNSSLCKKTGLLGAGIFVSHMAFTAATFAPVAQAQPDLNNAPKADNPTARVRPNRPNLNRDNRGGGGGERRNPEEGIRRLMTQAGVNDVATQNAVLEYMKTDMEARQPLRQQGAKVFQALREGAVSDEQLQALITDYRAAQQTEKTRREQAQAALDAQINYSKNPRLEAMLLLSGLIGEGGGLMMPSGGNFGGPGGRGGRGGQGGPGGPGAPQRGGENAANREQRQKRMLERYDANKDGKLDAAEEATMREQARQRREQRGNKQPAAPGNAMPEAGNA